jgi:hypothetical protein
MKQLLNNLVINKGKIIFLVLILSFFSQLNAQDSTYVSVFWNSPYLQEYKTTIAKAFKADSIDKIDINFYIRLTDTSYTDVFWGDEIFTMALIAKKYEKIFDNMQYFNNFRFEFPTPIGNYRDSILEYSTKYIKENENEIKNNIYKSDLDSCKKQFLIILTDFYALHSCDCDTTFRKKLIVDSKLYLNNCNDSLAPLIANRMAIKYEALNWGADVNFYSGGLFMSNNLKNYFNAQSVFLSGEIVLKYKNILFSVFASASFYSRIIQPFYYKVLWQDTHRFFMYRYEASLGYKIEISKRISIKPYFSIGHTGIAGINSYDSLYYKKTDLTAKNAFSFGFCINYNLTKNSIKFYNTGCQLQKENYPVILKLHFQNPRFDKLVPELSGNIFMISFGLGINSYFTKKIKLDY